MRSPALLLTIMLYLIVAAGNTVLAQRSRVAVGYQLILDAPPLGRYHIEGTKAVDLGRPFVLSHRDYRIVITLHQRQQQVELELQVKRVDAVEETVVLHVAERENWGEVMEILAQSDGVELHASFVARAL